MIVLTNHCLLRVQIMILELITNVSQFINNRGGQQQPEKVYGISGFL